MPEISRFYGIKIRMHFGHREHPPAHFHARYQHHSVFVALDGTVLHGSLPERELKLVREWAAQHDAELSANWERCNQNELPFKIAPLH